ncbi:MATE family efflux transporter [Vibrio diabolicus]|uniref:MATE family efflux transporter n=1 Tax=Vibrio diabolicus TaxID=50719 RepID=UPI0037513D4A
MIKDSVIALVIKVMGSALGLCINWLLIKKVGVGEAGYYYLALSYVALLRPILEFGFNNLLLKNGIGDCSNKSNAIKVDKLFVAFTNALFVFAVFYSVYFFFIRELFDVESVKILIDYLLPSYFILVIIGFISFFFQSEGKTIVSSLLVEPVYQFLFASSLVYFYVNGLEHVALYSLISSLIVLVISMTMLIKMLIDSGALKKYSLPNISFIKAVLKESLSIMTLSILAALSNNLFQVILGNYVSSEELAIYSLSLRISIVISFVLICVSKVSSPVISRLHSEGKQMELNFYLKKATVFSFVSSLVLGSLIMYFSSDLLSFFDNDLSNGNVILIILCVGQVFNSLTGPVASVLIMTGLTNYVRKVSVYSLILSTTFAVLLIPIYGIYAASSIFSINMIFQNMTCYLIMKNKLDLNPLRLKVR